MRVDLAVVRVSRLNNIQLVSHHLRIVIRDSSSKAPKLQSFTSDRDNHNTSQNGTNNAPPKGLQIPSRRRRLIPTRRSRRGRTGNPHKNIHRQRCRQNRSLQSTLSPILLTFLLRIQANNIVIESVSRPPNPIPPPLPTLSPPTFQQHIPPNPPLNNIPPPNNLRPLPPPHTPTPTTHNNANSRSPARNRSVEEIP